MFADDAVEQSLLGLATLVAPLPEPDEQPNSKGCSAERGRASFREVL